MAAITMTFRYVMSVELGDDERRRAERRGTMIAPIPAADRMAPPMSGL